MENENLINELYKKVTAEYVEFISDMREQDTEIAIESAYEIVWKDNITQYLENEELDLTEEQCNALLSVKNSLDEIYECFLKEDGIKSYNDLGFTFKDTADRIQISFDREYVSSVSREEIGGNATDKTFAFEIGHSAPFTVVHLDIGTDERKNAVSKALKNIIDNVYSGKRDVQPYKNLLKQIKPTSEFVHANQGHLSCLKYALSYAETDKELCLSMLDSIKHSEENLTPVVTIKGYECIPKDAWEDHGVTYNIGQCIDDPTFYYARATDGKIKRDYEYDHEPSREKVMSDHTDKLSEEYMDRYESEYGADGYKVFSADEDDGEEFEP